MRHPIRSRRTAQAALALVLVLGIIDPGTTQGADAPKPNTTKDRPTNRLAQESSPYLLQHAHNPVDWYPWCPEAFAQAKKEGKLVFLSIGYSSCHWCHVMERESFENAEVAKLMNDWFVCIKVDREERPDIDNIYMTALNVQGIRGGWPLSMFLTAEAKPIIGGTYWPPEDRRIEGEDRPAPGFKTVLKVMHDWQVEKPKRVQARADDVADKTTEALTKTVPGSPIIKLDRQLVQAALDDLKERFDSEYGGFGSPARKFRGPKFPSPPDLELLLQQGEGAKFNEVAKMATLTLDKMAQGGIYDQLGGGFHRYSTERTWTVPHFEKMLYDNAQLAEVYAHAYRLRPNPLYRRILEETLGFVAREMTSPEGGFYSALDADSNGVEGQCYTWTPRQIDLVLTDKSDADLVKRIYGIAGQPNFEEKFYIPVLPNPLTESARDLKLTEEQLHARLQPLRRKLLESRSQRPQPFRDTKILTGWNGQMIAGYAAAGQVLNEPRYLATAVRAAEFALKNLRTKDGRLRRVYASRPGRGGEARLNGYLDDYAYLTHGLLCLHDTTGDRRWLEEARSLTDTMIQYHLDDKDGGFFYTSNDHEKLFARSKDQYDGAQPSGNSAAARNLVRLWTKTGEQRYRDLAEKTFKTFAAPLKINPAGLTAMAGAFSLYLDDQEKQPKEDKPEKEKPSKGGVKKSDSVVKIKATVEPEKPGDDGKQVVTVTLTIDKGWHLYANPVGSEDLESSRTQVSVSAKKKPEDVSVDYPEGKEVKDETAGKYKIYEDKVTIKATVKRAKGDTGPLEVTIKFQSCSDKSCLLPATKKITVP